MSPCLEMRAIAPVADFPTMHITAVETFPVEVPLKRERWMVSSLGEHKVSRYLLVRVLTDSDIEGAGEATVTARWSGESVWTAHSMIERVLAPVVIGCDRRRRRRNRPPHGRGLRRQLVRQERHRDGLLGHSRPGDRPADLQAARRPRAAAGRPQPLQHGRLRARARRRQGGELVAAGFTTIKIKVGRDARADVERVRRRARPWGPTSR